MNEYRPKVAIITGAARGLGKEFAWALCETMQVVLVDTDPSVEELASEIADYTSRAFGIMADLSLPEKCREVVSQALTVSGKIDVLINNTSMWRETPLEDPWNKAVDDFDAIMNTNVKAAMMMMRLCSAGMRRNGGGDIVNVTTYDCLPARAADTNWEGSDAYNASRWAINGLTDAAAILFKDANIRVNGLAVGPADNPMRREKAAKFPEETATRYGPVKTNPIAGLLMELLKDGRTGENIGVWPGQPVELGSRKRWDAKIRERVDFTGQPGRIYGPPPWSDAPPPVDHLAVGRP